MRDEELMDRLLRDAMTADAPELPADFDARVMARLHPPRLSIAARVVMALYGVASAAAAMWLMRDLPIGWIAAALTMTAAAAACASAYVRGLAAHHLR